MNDNSDSNKPHRVCVSGYFDPLHKGHVEYLTRAKELAGSEGKLVVIVNNDYQAFLKKGKSFMKDAERVLIIKALRVVDEVHLSIDEDRTVRKTIASIEPRITYFVNGGDQTNESIPETPVCESLGIQLVDGLGDKIQSSSWLTGIKAK
jgi:cytidyltransferase-like protein